MVLTNITYTGNLLLQKEYISDPISKQRKKNRGELPQYYVEDTHPAIIDKATFDYVQEEIARRRELGARANKSLNTCCFTGKIKGPYCGVSYMHNNRTDRGGLEFWNCGSKKKKKVGSGCPVGSTITRECRNTGHQDCWTPERRAAKAEFMKKEMAMRKAVKERGKESDNDPGIN